VTETLVKFGSCKDADIDLAPAALSLALLDSPDVKLGRYFNHINKLCDQVAARHKKLLEAGADDDAEAQLAALKYVMVDMHDYRLDGDGKDHLQRDHIQNASLIRTIDRGKGGAMVLSLLYVHVARAQGWQADIISMPGDAVCRLEYKAGRLLFDAARRCVVLNAPDLRERIKKEKGKQAELSSSYFEPLGNRDILIALQNFVKLRQIEAEDYESALRCVEALRLLAPDEYRLCLDAGILYAKTGQGEKAVPELHEYIDKTPDPTGRTEAKLLLLEIEEALQSPE